MKNNNKIFILRVICFTILILLALFLIFENYLPFFKNNKSIANDIGIIVCIIMLILSQICLFLFNINKTPEILNIKVFEYSMKYKKNISFLQDLDIFLSKKRFKKVLVNDNDKNYYVLYRKRRVINQKPLYFLIVYNYFNITKVKKRCETDGFIGDYYIFTISNKKVENYSFIEFMHFVEPRIVSAHIIPKLSISTLIDFHSKKMLIPKPINFENPNIMNVDRYRKILEKNFDIVFEKEYIIDVD